MGLNLVSDEYDQFSEEVQRIYRFRPLSGDFGRSTAEDIILHNQMYWTSPDQFNDPMDCRPNFLFGQNDESRRKWVRNAVRNNHPNVPRHERMRIEKEMLRDSPHVHRANATQGFDEWMRESAVCCFAKEADNLLLWAHYADSHRGVCYIFQETMEPEPFVAFDVKYADKRPEIDITTFGNQAQSAMRDSVLTKASDWSYEAEKRMFNYRIQAGQKAFDPTVLRGVIFGSRVDSDDEAFVRSLVANRSGEMELWRAVLSESEFAMRIELVE